MPLAFELNEGIKIQSFRSCWNQSMYNYVLNATSTIYYVNASLSSTKIGQNVHFKMKWKT